MDNILIRLSLGSSGLSKNNLPKVLVTTPNLVFSENENTTRSRIWSFKDGVFCLLIGVAYFNSEFLENDRKVENQRDLDKIINKLSENSIDKLTTGFYNFFYFNFNTRKFYIQSSHFGMRPLFYHCSDQEIVISTNATVVNKYNNYKHNIDSSAMFQIYAFNYIISDTTCFKGIMQMKAGSRLEYNNGRWLQEKFFKSIDLIKKPVYSKKDSVEIIEKSLAKVMNKYLNNSNSSSISLTGGWDGRLLMAYSLNRSSTNLNSYSHGNPFDKDVTIPKNIAHNMGFNYTPYVLDKHYYLNDFEQYALDTVLNSSGTRSISRSHYLYSVGSELKKNGTVITGICGSNLLKTGGYIAGNVANNNVLNFIMNDNFDEFFATLEHQVKGFILKKSFDMDKLREDLFTKYSEYKAIDDKHLRYFSFLLDEIERKYFGNEILCYGHLGENLAPFIDIDFVSALVQTTYFGAYMRPSKNNPFLTWESSILYAKIINNLNPQIGKFESDKGVSLYDLSKKARWGKVVYKYIKRKMIKDQAKGYDHAVGLNKIVDYLSKKDYRSGTDLEELTKNNKGLNQLSLLYWLSNIDELEGLI